MNCVACSSAEFFTVLCYWLLVLEKVWVQSSCLYKMGIHEAGEAAEPVWVGVGVCGMHSCAWVTGLVYVDSPRKGSSPLPIDVVSRLK